MGFMDKAKAAAEQAAVKAKEGVDKAKEGVEDVTSKRETSQAYAELGRVAYSLVQRGEISHAELAPLAERISELEKK